MHDPLNLPHNLLQYLLPKLNFILSVIAMSVGDRSYIDKAQLGKTLYIECMKHNRQLKVNFLAGKQNMKQYRPKMFLACNFSVSLFYAREWWANS